MKKVITTGAALLLTTSIASAGGLDRSGQSISPIFEDGQYAELSFGSVVPDVSGVFAGAVDSGNVGVNYVQLGAAFKSDINDQLSYAIIIDQPYGANVEYDTAGYPLDGSKAEFRSTGLTALGRYKIDGNFSVHAGIRAVTIDADADVVVAGAFSYSAEYDSDTQFSYVVGAAYERPEIALRVALTYSSETEFTHKTQVSGVDVADTEYTMPQSVNLDFQTGIAEDTLVFGSIRWAEWSKTNIDSAGYPLNPIVGHDNDTVSYNVGLGRRFSDNFSGSIAYGYEKSDGGISANLAPTDGNSSVSLGGAYTFDGGIEVSGGVRYIFVGDATTDIGGTAAEFEDNTAVGLGLKIAYNY